jgi:hypothetical protein
MYYILVELEILVCFLGFLEVTFLVGVLGEVLDFGFRGFIGDGICGLVYESGDVVWCYFFNLDV